MKRMPLVKTNKYTTSEEKATNNESKRRREENKSEKIFYRKQLFKKGTNFTLYRITGYLTTQP